MWPLSYVYMCSLFVSIGLICKACSLGLVHFTGETLSVSFQKCCSTDGSNPMGLGASQVVSEQGSTTLGCDLSHAFHIAI